MAPSKLLLLVFTFLTLACSKPKVLDQHSVWTLSRADAVANEDFRTIKVKFRDNGYAYETNTILKYPYRIYSAQNIFEFNRKNYRILSWKDREIVLQNSSTNVVIVLRRE